MLLIEDRSTQITWSHFIGCTSTKTTSILFELQCEVNYGNVKKTLDEYETFSAAKVESTALP